MKPVTPVTIEYELDKEDIQKLDAVIGISCQGVWCPGCPMLLRKPFAGYVCVKEILQIVRERSTNNGD